MTDRDGPVGANGKPALKRFTFDRMYTPKTTQNEIYQDVKPLTMSVLDGYNCCVFAYGQTGTGKTHTMQGPASDPGVTYRAVKDLFETAERAVMHGYTFSFRISVLEIYNERIFDLLVDPRTAQERRRGKEDLAVHIDMQRGVRVEGLTELGVDSVSNVLDIIQLAQVCSVTNGCCQLLSVTCVLGIIQLAQANCSVGLTRVHELTHELAQANRSIGVTSANEHSSRSHLIVTLYVTKEDQALGKQVKEKKEKEKNNRASR